MPRHNDHRPIFAVSTTAHRAALHLQRLSGDSIFSLLAPHLRNPKTGDALAATRWPPQTTTPVLLRAHLLDHQGNLIDEIMISGFKAPHSFTGEDVVEIASHGNPIILSKIQTLLRSLSLRDAEPGEFTERAFRNGKMDLTQAEAVHEIITARSDLAIKLAHNAASGRIADATFELRKQIIETLAYLEAHIDFAEDEVGSFDATLIIPALQTTVSRLESLAQTFETATRARDGLRVCFAGKPNAGKSSLFNAILQKERAIVTNIPGTTRDVLEDHFLYHNRDFVLLDTAGLRESSDTIERIGIERSNTQIREADLVCLLVDVSHANSPEEAKQATQAIVSEISAHKSTNSILVVVSKNDITKPEFVLVAREQALAMGVLHAVEASHKFVENVLNSLCDAYDTLSKTTELEHSTVLISTRQRDKTLAAAKHLREAVVLAANRGFPESIASLIIMGKHDLEDIVGVIAVNDVLETLFSHFCVGK